MNETVQKLKKMFEEAGLSKEVTAGLLGNIEIESNFKPIKESLKYSSVERIKAVFPSKVKGMSYADIQKLVMNEKGLGNLVYADKGGFMYRGRGFIQITGKTLYEEYGKLIGVDLINNPDLACDEKIAGKIAIEYIKKVGFKFFKDINTSKDINYVVDCVTKSIQGVKKNYSSGFLLDHLLKKRKASLKYYK